MIRILIAEDEPLILDGIAAIIEEEWADSVVIEKAHDGAEALDRMEKQAPDLVITDIYMPELSGLELIEQARMRGLCTRFIILSGYDDFSLVKKGIQLHVIDYLLKPVDRKELLDVLATIASELESLCSPWVERKILPNSTMLSDSIASAVKYIEDHYNHEMTLEEMAGVIHLHPNYVSALFKKDTGMAFVKYVQQYRIMKAQEIIRLQPEISFSEVAFIVGYDSPPHFYKLFKRITGLTPGQYRDRGSTQE